MIASFSYRITLTFISFFMFMNLASAQSHETSADDKAARKWVKNKSWSNRMNFDVDPSVNALEFKKQYEANKAVWDKAFTFIKEHNLETLAAGKYPIDGDNTYATITDAPSRQPDQAKWESHNKYIDLQYVIGGKEKIEVAPVSTLTVANPYNESRDAANYTGKGTYHTAKPGTFFLFFPPDAHRPNILVNGFDTVKKLVIKIKVAQ